MILYLLTSEGKLKWHPVVPIEVPVAEEVAGMTQLVCSLQIDA